MAQSVAVRWGHKLTGKPVCRLHEVGLQIEDPFNIIHIDLSIH